MYACAVLLEDSKLLAKLGITDMVTLEAKYHTKCLVDLYNRARKAKASSCESMNQMEIISGISFAELVLYIEELHQHHTERATVFKLADLAYLYVTRMEQLGLKLDIRLHTTRLKQRLLTKFMDMRAQKKGQDILLVFEDDIGPALAKHANLMAITMLLS